MLDLHTHAKLQQLVLRLDPRASLLRAWELTGGVSARVTALEIQQPGGTILKLVVREYGPNDRTRNPNIARDEFNLLQILHTASMPTPAPFYFDQSAAILPGPYLVTEFMEGQTQFAPLNLDDFLLQMASNLARLHSFDWSLYDLSFLAHQSHHYDLTFATPPARLDNTLDEGRIRAALTPAWPFPHRNLSVLLHGDYWPGNILWRNDRLAAVIDWEDAHLGDPLADLAISRLEILWAFDLDAMRLFTNYYRRASNLDFTALPYWDLCAALRPAFQIATWAGNPTREQAMREKHLLFVSQAFDALPA